MMAAEAEKRVVRAKVVGRDERGEAVVRNQVRSYTLRRYKAGGEKASVGGWRRR